MSVESKDLIQSFEEWILFIHTLKGLDPSAWESSIEPGKWKVRDIISHIMMWDKYFYEEAIQKVATNQAVTSKHLDYDEFNNHSMTYGRTITTDELMEKTIAYREKIIVAINSLSDEDRIRNYSDGDGHVFNITQYLKDFIWHDQHHMNPLKAYLVRDSGN